MPDAVASLLGIAAPAVDVADTALAGGALTLPAIDVVAPAAGGVADVASAGAGLTGAASEVAPAVGVASSGGLLGGLSDLLTSPAAASTPQLGDTLAPTTPGLSPNSVVSQGFNDLTAPTTGAPAPGTLGTSQGSPLPGGNVGAASLGNPSVAPIDSAPTIGPGAGAQPLDISAGTNAPNAAAKTGGGFGDFLSNNKGLLASLGIGGAGVLAAPLLSKAISPVPQQSQLNQVAGQAGQLAGGQTSYGNTLQQPLVTGQLPPGAQQTVDNATNDAISTTKAKYAQLGLTGSTMEADAISNIQNQKTQIAFNIAENMAQTGGAAISTAANALGLQESVYQSLMNAQVSQDTALQQAIARLAAGAALGSGTSSATKTAAGTVNALT